MRRLFRLSTGDCRFILTPLTIFVIVNAVLVDDSSGFPANSFALKSFLIMAYHDFSHDFTKRQLEEESRASTIRMYVLGPPTFPCNITKCTHFSYFPETRLRNNTVKKENKNC